MRFLYLYFIASKEIYLTVINQIRIYKFVPVGRSVVILCHCLFVYRLFEVIDGPSWLDYLACIVTYLLGLYRNIIFVNPFFVKNRLLYILIGREVPEHYNID